MPITVVGALGVLGMMAHTTAKLEETMLRPITLRAAILKLKVFPLVSP